VTSKRFSLFVMTLLASSAAIAGGLPVQNLTVIGDDKAAGIIGTYPVKSSFGWMNHIVSPGTTGFSWQLNSGSDGGIRFGRGQPDSGQMLSVRAMYNKPTTFLSVNNGLLIAADGTLDMSNLRMLQSGVQIDIAANAASVLVPLVADVSVLPVGDNGWELNPDGSYHIVFNTIAICDTCPLILHLAGNRVDADGDITGDGMVKANDIVLAIRAIFGLYTLDPIQAMHTDIAPLVNGEPQPDGNIDSGDLVVLMQRATTLP